MPLSPAHVDDGYFDSCGNSLQLQPGSEQPLSWNGRNGLAAVTLVARTQSAQSDREAYQYDGSGQRLRKTTLRYKDNGKTCQRETLSSGSEAKLSEELHLLSGSGGRAVVQVLHWASGRPADMSNDGMRVSLGDQIGSATLELDGDARIITLEEYYPYGGTAVSSATSQSEADYKFRRYSGKEQDATGLYYYGLRYYQPWIGRWLNPDPAGTIDGLNLFRMVRNNPVTLRDNDGRVATERKKHQAHVQPQRPLSEPHASQFEAAALSFLNTHALYEPEPAARDIIEIKEARYARRRAIRENTWTNSFEQKQEVKFGWQKYDPVRKPNLGKVQGGLIDNELFVLRMKNQHNKEVYYKQKVGIKRSDDNTETRELLPVVSKVTEQLDRGTYNFAILADEPKQVYIMESSRTNAILGHSSITLGKDVSYAGTVDFEDDGTLMFWNNDSGHYQPSKTDHRKNIHPELRRILRFEKFGAAPYG